MNTLEGGLFLKELVSVVAGGSSGMKPCDWKNPWMTKRFGRNAKRGSGRVRFSEMRWEPIEFRGYRWTWRGLAGGENG